MLYILFNIRRYLWGYSDLKYSTREFPLKAAEVPENIEAVRKLI